MLRRYALLVILGWAGVFAASGQQVSKQDYQAWISTRDSSGNHYFRGHLSELQDSTLLFADRKSVQPHLIPVQTVETLQFRAKGRLLRGAILGTVAGLATGYFLGTAFYEESDNVLYTREMSGLVLGAGLGTVGFGIGALLGEQKIKIKIGRSHTEYQRQRDVLQQYVQRDRR